MFVPSLFVLALAVCSTPTVEGGAPPCATVVVEGFATDGACQAAAQAIATAIRPAGGGQAVGSCTAVRAPLEA